MSIRETQLENGIRVLSETRSHVETTALGVWVGAGARNERASEHGISHLLEHMAFKGTGRRSAREIAEAIENVGGDLNAATSYEATAYYARVLGKDVPLAIDLLSDILTGSAFDPHELASEQHVILQEIGAVHDTPEDLVHDLLQEASYPDQPIGRSILGTPESVAGFVRDDLTAYLDRHYRGPSTVIVAVGAVDHDSLVAQVAERFGRLSGESGPGIDSARFVGGERRIDRDLEQVQIGFAMEAPALADPRFYAARLAAAVLGGGMSSRLFQEVRERRGLCYSIYAYSSAFRDTGVFGVSAATAPGDVPELVESMFGQMRDVAKSVTDEELDRAKAQLKVGILMGLESSAARAEQIARQTLLLDRIVEADEIVTRIDAVTRADVMDVLAAAYAGPGCALSAIGPIDGLESVTTLKERLLT